MFCFNKIKRFIINREMEKESIQEIKNTLSAITKNGSGQNPAEREDESFEKTCKPAEILGEGWQWVSFDDGSGSLEHNGEAVVVFEGGPFASSSIQYRMSHGEWDFFEGTIDEFKKFVENKILKEG